MRLLIPVLATLSLLSGCVHIVVPTKAGDATYTRWGSTSIGELRVDPETGEVVLAGYQSEGASLAEGVARGVASGLKPTPLP
ncbi:MAG: hypothetical protein AAF797_17660 [Planctomycetota bacterium]